MNFDLIVDDNTENADSTRQQEYDGMPVNSVFSLSVAPPPAPVSEQERLTNPGDYEELGKKVKGSSGD